MRIYVNYKIGLEHSISKGGMADYTVGDKKFHSTQKP